MTKAQTLISVALRPEEGEALWIFGGLMTFKATAEQTGGEFVLVELLVRRGMGAPLDVHPEDPSSFYVLDGRLTFYIGEGKAVPATGGSFIHVPAGTPVGFRVESETARLLRLGTPQTERFFRATGEPAIARTLPLDDPQSQMGVEAPRKHHRQQEEGSCL